MPYAHVMRWRDGLIVYFKAYVQREDALRDLGLSEDALEPNRSVKQAIAQRLLRFAEARPLRVPARDLRTRGTGALFRHGT
jgi:hypothetical protein